MKNEYKPIKPMKEVPNQLRKLRRQFLRYQQAEIVYSLSHKKLFELASDAGAIYRFDSTVLINRDIFDAYLQRLKQEEKELLVYLLALDIGKIALQIDCSVSNVYRKRRRLSNKLEGLKG